MRRMMRSRSNKAGRDVSRADVERLLSGSVSDDEKLGQLPSIVKALGRASEASPAEEEVQKFAAEAAKQVPLGPDRSGAARAGAVGAAGGLGARRRRLVMRLAGATAAVMVVLGGFSGFAYAADGAVPGDTLYGVDLALEKVGIGAGGLQERLTEASQLVERGQAQEGLDLASDAVAQSAGEDAALRSAADALRAATQSAIESQSLNTIEELGATAERLRQMASEEKTSEELGQAVEDLAGSLSSKGGTGGGTGSGQDQGGSMDTPGSDTGGEGSPTDPAGSVTTSTTIMGMGDGAGGGRSK